MEARNLRVLFELKCIMCDRKFSSYKRDKKCCSKKCTDKDYSLRHKEEKKAYDKIYNAVNSEKNVRRSAEYRLKNKSKRWSVEKKRFRTKKIKGLPNDQIIPTLSNQWQKEFEAKHRPSTPLWWRGLNEE